MKINNENAENKKSPVFKISRKQKGISDKKAKLARAERQTKWAPIWVVLRKFGTGKRVHPSAITRYRRSWRRTKLHIKPRKIRRDHFK